MDNRDIVGVKMKRLANFLTCLGILGALAYINSDDINWLVSSYSQCVRSNAFNENIVQQKVVYGNSKSVTRYAHGLIYVLKPKKASKWKFYIEKG